MTYEEIQISKDSELMIKVISLIASYAVENDMSPNETIKTVAENMLGLLKIVTFENWEKKTLPSVISTSEDCVSRQAVKEGMIKYGFHAPDMTVTEFVEDELPPVTPTQRWIPVSERLPKKTGWYFVTFPISDNATNGDMMLAIFKEIQYYSDGKICADWWNAPYKRGNENDV